MIISIIWNSSEAVLSLYYKFSPWMCNKHEPKLSLFGSSDPDLKSDLCFSILPVPKSSLRISIVNYILLSELISALLEQYFKHRSIGAVSSKPLLKIDRFPWSLLTKRSIWIHRRSSCYRRILNARRFSSPAGSNIIYRTTIHMVSHFQ